MTAKRMRLLVVDDEDAHQKMIAQTMKDFADCTACTTFQCARDALKDEAFDAAVIDLRMGADRGLPLVPDLGLPVVVLTQQDDVETACAALKAGAHEYVVKSELTPSVARRVLMLAAARQRLQRAVDVHELAARLHDRIADPAMSLLMNLSVIQESLGPRAQPFASVFRDMEAAVGAMTQTTREVQDYASGIGPRPHWTHIEADDEGTTEST